MLKTIIIDDEKKCQAVLQNLLKTYCPDVDIIGIANNVADGVKLLKSLSPELVILDISMPDGTGFDVLEQIEHKNFNVIFTTAFNNYAVKAFQYAAIHYLLKPIDYIQLQDAINRCRKNSSDVLLSDKLQVLSDNLNQINHKIILPTTIGLRMVEIDSIMRCESDGAYTIFYLNNNTSMMVSKGISNFEEVLPEHLFCRSHNKHLVNLNYVDQYIKGRGGRIILSNGNEIEVSESRKKQFKEKLKAFAHSL